MESNPNQQPQPNRRRNKKPFLFITLLPLIVLIISISIPSTNTKIQHLKSSLPISFSQTISRFLNNQTLELKNRTLLELKNQTFELKINRTLLELKNHTLELRSNRTLLEVKNQTLELKSNRTLHELKDHTLELKNQKLELKLKPTQSISKPPYCVLWMAPFLSGGGYSSEAWSYILSINQELKNNSRFDLAIEHHGDFESIDFWDGLPQNMKDLAFELYDTRCRVNQTIVVCHSEPGAWYPPLYQTLSCPPVGYGKFMSVIGRTMFETDRVNSRHVGMCNRMDYVWVPTDFHVSTFVKSGVDPSKVVKIVQPIDVKFFDPLKYTPFDLSSVGNLVLGSKNEESSKDFVFLSIFKWEYRKGWDILLRGYLKEFSNADGVALYLLTNPYHSDRNFSHKIVDFVESSDLVKPIGGWPPIYVIDTHIAQIDLPRLYKAADAFVLPSRGEGWGRPLVEAMAMSLPVIATNWSGPTEYLTEDNSYLLSVDRMSVVADGPFEGHLWAEPSIDELQILMRDVMSNVEKAKARGRKARKDMIRRFSPEIVAKIVTDNIQGIIANVIR